MFGRRTVTHRLLSLIVGFLLAMGVASVFAVSAPPLFTFSIDHVAGTMDVTLFYRYEAK